MIKSPFFVNSSYLYLSHFFDYLLSLILLPFIARSVGVEEFGRIGLAQTFALLLILFMEFGSQLILTREVSREKNNLPKLKRLIENVITLKILLLPLAFIASTTFFYLVPSFKNHTNYIFIAAIGAIFQGTTPFWYFQGVEKMRIIALSKIFFRLIGFTLILFFVKSSGDGWIVLGSYSLTSILICINLHFFLIKDVGRLNFINSKGVYKIFKKSINSFLITIIPLLHQNISMLALSLFINPLYLGIYFGANRIYMAFNSLFSPLSQAFYPLITSEHKKNTIKSKILIQKYLLYLLFVGMLFFCANFFFGEMIIYFLLGNEFLDAKELLKLLGIVLPITAINNALGRQWLMVNNKDFEYLFSQAISTILSLFLFLAIVNVYGLKALPISIIVFELTALILISIFLIKYKLAF